MRTAYEVVGAGSVGVYATRRRAEELVARHPMLELRIEEIEISTARWLLLKAIFQ